MEVNLIEIMEVNLIEIRNKCKRSPLQASVVEKMFWRKYIGEKRGFGINPSPLMEVQFKWNSKQGLKTSVTKVCGWECFEENTSAKNGDLELSPW